MTPVVGPGSDPVRDVAAPVTTPPGVGAVRASTLREREDAELEPLLGMRLGVCVEPPELVELDPLELEPEVPEDPVDPPLEPEPDEPELGGGAVRGTA